MTTDLTNSTLSPDLSQEAEEAPTKTQLLDAAETLFERNGIRGTSLRNITELAKANIASVNYHFGSKKELVRAVIARRIDPLNAERLRLLNALEERGHFDLEEVLYALIAPAIQHPHLYPGLRLLARLHFEPNTEFFELVHQPFEEVQRRFLAAVHQAAPSISNLALHWRLSFGVGAMAATIANLEKIRSGAIRAEHLPKGAPDPSALASDPDTVARQLVRFLAGGMRAKEVKRPSPPAAKATKARRSKGSTP